MRARLTTWVVVDRLRSIGRDLPAQISAAEWNQVHGAADQGEPRAQLACLLPVPV